jgi:hypothetical protein
MEVKFHAFYISVPHSLRDEVNNLMREGTADITEAYVS